MLQLQRRSVDGKGGEGNVDYEPLKALAARGCEKIRSATPQTRHIQSTEGI